MYHIPEIETQSIAAQRQVQMQHLQVLLEYLQQQSPFYKQLFADNNIDIKNIVDYTDLQQLPTTSKEDIQLREKDFVCVPKEAIREYTTTSGTLGKPISIALTESDLSRLAYNEFRSLVSMDVQQASTIQLALTLDRQFMAGMAYYMGAKDMGAVVIRTGSGLPQMQWDTIKRYDTDVLVAVPSFVLKMIEYAKQHNIDYKNSGVKKILAIGESLRDANGNDSVLAQKLKAEWDIEYYNTYASTEMQTAFTECNQHNGGHHLPELIVIELIDENGNHVPENESGEVCITTLGVKGMPLLRYRTGDICKAFYEPCACGRSTLRLSGVIGRKKQMIKLKGTTLYPNIITETLNEIEKVKEYVIHIFTNELQQDDIKISLSLHQETDTTQKVIKEHLRSKLKLMPQIEICDDDTIRAMQFPLESRKQIRIIDSR